MPQISIQVSTGGIQHASHRLSREVARLEAAGKRITNIHFPTLVAETCWRSLRFRGARGGLIKIIWHDGIGMSLYAKRLEHGRFVWPSPADGTLAISAAQLAYMLGGIDWRNSRHTWRPASAG
jgi:IS66 Orf2 like protein